MRTFPPRWLPGRNPINFLEFPGPAGFAGPDPAATGAHCQPTLKEFQRDGLAAEVIRAINAGIAQSVLFGCYMRRGLIRQSSGKCSGLGHSLARRRVWASEETDIMSCQSPIVSKSFARLTAAVMSVGVLLIATGATTQSAFARAASLDGTWSGGGYVNGLNGQRERVRCRVSYRRRTSTIYSVSATCATRDTSIRQTGEVLKVRADRYVGDFYNAQFNISGRVRIRVRGRRQSVTFSSSRGGGAVQLRKR